MDIPPPDVPSPAAAADVPDAPPAVGRVSERDRKRFVFRAGRRRRRPEASPPEFCLNCGMHVPQHHAYCGGCGQENTPSAVSFSILVQEACEEFIKIDSKLVKTLIPLLFKPGLLTQEYVAGRRMRYLSPFKMYAAVSALFFVVFGVLIPADTVSVNSKKHPKPPDPPQQTKTVTDVPASDHGDAKKTNKGKAKTQSSEADSASAPSETPNRRLLHGDVHMLGERIDADILPDSVAEYRSSKLYKQDHGMTRLLKEKVIKFNDSPSDMIRDFLTSMLPLLMLFQLPLLALLMKLFYVRSRRLYVEHLVFVLHTHTFLFLLLSPFLLVEILARYVSLPAPLILDKSPLLKISLIGVLVVYHIVALRRVYRQSVAKTLVKAFILSNSYLWLLLFSASISIILTLVWTLILP